MPTTSYLTVFQQKLKQKDCYLQKVNYVNDLSENNGKNSILSNITKQQCSTVWDTTTVYTW